MAGCLLVDSLSCLANGISRRFRRTVVPDRRSVLLPAADAEPLVLALGNAAGLLCQKSWLVVGVTGFVRLLSSILVHRESSSLPVSGYHLRWTRFL